MSLARNMNKKTRIIYIYKSKSYWNPDLKAPRSHRTLVGRIMPGSTEMIPTGTKGGVRKKKSVQEKEADWKAERAAREIREAEEALQQSDTLDYRRLYEEPRQSFEVTEMQKNRQIRELQDLITEQRNCLDAAHAKIDEMLRKTQMNLSSLSKDT